MSALVFTPLNLIKRAAMEMESSLLMIMCFLCVYCIYFITSTILASSILKLHQFVGNRRHLDTFKMFDFVNVYIMFNSLETVLCEGSLISNNDIQLPKARMCTLTHKYLF